MRVTPSVVASTAHFLVFAYVASALLRGARSPERKQLGLAFSFFAAYSAGMSTYALVPEAVWDASMHRYFDLSLVLATEATVRLASLAGPLHRLKKHARVPRWGRALVIAAAGAWIASMVVTERARAVTGLVLLFAFVGALVAFARAMRSWKGEPQARAPRDFFLACLWPFAALLPFTMLAAGVPINAHVYEVVRDLSVLAFAFALVIAFLDHTPEATTLLLRFSIGTLTVVLSALVIATEVAVLAAPDRHVGYTISGRLLLVVVASEAFVVYTFPLLYRRNLVEPLRSLLDGVKAIEGGSLEAHVDVSRPDEIGSLATSFNHMVDSLKETNDELRRQIVARSRDLADVLEEASPKSLHIGQTIDERYAITRVVGGGGMGIVYGAERVTDKRPLAIKIMSGSTTHDDAARFAREAEIAAQLHHPNLVSVLDVGVWEGRPYLVMELVEGGSLEDGRARFGDIPWAIPILGQIARGLAALHEGGIVHRDLKPANVLLGPTGAKITDFGIARQDDAAIGLAATVGVDAPTARASITRTGAIVGTLPYMAPELARGSKNASAASDVFALGLVAYEMLTGKLPFDLPPVMLGLAGKPLGPFPALPEDVPPELAARITACLRSDPKDRPPAAELAQ